jgi:mannose-6-phosphate isomerase-like protein (cupin superfamily)
MKKKQSIAQVASRLTQPFKRIVIGDVDDYCAYLTLIKGTYLWHQHVKDEMYLVLEGTMTVEYEGGASVTLNEQESLVVRAGANHRTHSEQGAVVLMFKARDIFLES